MGEGDQHRSRSICLSSFVYPVLTLHQELCQTLFIQYFVCSLKELWEVALVPLIYLFLFVLLEKAEVQIHSRGPPASLLGHWDFNPGLSAAETGALNA